MAGLCYEEELLPTPDKLYRIAAKTRSIVENLRRFAKAAARRKD
ncbi:hypothetical protein [Funiculus sociatus]